MQTWAARANGYRKENTVPSRQIKPLEKQKPASSLPDGKRASFQICLSNSWWSHIPALFGLFSSTDTPPLVCSMNKSISSKQIWVLLFCISHLPNNNGNVIVVRYIWRQKNNEIDRSNENARKAEKTIENSVLTRMNNRNPGEHLIASAC